jgi:hypothetical protein
MNSETTFTTSSGLRCMFEVLIDEKGGVDVNVVWLDGKPTDADMDEFRSFIKLEAKKAGFGRTTTSDHMLGAIQREDLPRLREIVDERKRNYEAAVYPAKD